MTRLPALAAALAAGCLTAPPLTRVGEPPHDPEHEAVERAIGAAALPSFDRNLTGDGWVPHVCLRGSGGGTREYHWQAQFACQNPGDAPAGPVWRLPAGGYGRILTPVRADVLAAVEATGLEIVSAPPPEFRDGPDPEARFVIRYLRKNRAVAGEVVGAIRPDTAGSGPDTRYTDLTVTLREWRCR